MKRQVDFYLKNEIKISCKLQTGEESSIELGGACVGEPVGEGGVVKYCLYCTTWTGRAG